MVRPITPSRDEATGALYVALTGLARRQRAIAHNLANVDTPGFKAHEVRFEERLTAALQRHPSALPLQRTSQSHLPLRADRIGDLRPIEQEITSLTYRNDGNNVDIDSQMSQLAETQLRFTAATQVMSSHIGQLRTIINDGRR
jgi:flagellar basal-body rod protein FlgB